LVGAFYPTMVDLSKTTVERSVSLAGRRLETVEARTYPFSPLSVVLVDDALQVSLGVLVVARKSGWRSFMSDGSLFLKMLPLGFLYAVGELLTLRSVQKGSGPVYVVMSNMKLVVAALISRAFFGRSVAMPWLHWFELVLISLAASTYTFIEADSLGRQWNWEGVWMALAKSALVAFLSVFCEHTYKNNPFHLTLTLQAFWGLMTVLTMALISTSGLGLSSLALELQSDDGVPSLFGAGSKHPLCDSREHELCVRGLQRIERTDGMVVAACQCVLARGWDVYTLLTVLANLSNAITSALVFRQLSAVMKYVCRATSAVPMYIFYYMLGRTSWSLRTFLVVLYLCAQASVYTLQRHYAAAESTDGCSDWPKHYPRQVPTSGSSDGELRLRAPHNA